jgi:multisubunit Na+/H+ antiporter MnhE subunit
MKNETKLGMLVLVVFLIANQLLHMQYLLLGLLIGVALCFIIIGGLPEKHYSTIKSFKQKIYKKFSTKNNKTP